MGPAVQDAQEEERGEIRRVKGVVRIDISARKQTHGWQARLYTGRTAITQFFSDSKCGGREGSFEEAVAALSRLERGVYVDRRKRPEK